MAPTVADVEYHVASLQFGTRPWSAKEAVRRVSDDLGDGEFAGVLQEFTERHVEDLIVDHAGDSGLALAMQYLAGCDVYIRADGQPSFINLLDNSSAERALRRAEPEIWGGGHPQRVTLEFQRPSAVLVYFTVEQEVRFDYGVGQTVTQDGRFMVNVIQVPDATLQLPDGSIVIRGAWVPFDTILQAWNNDKGSGPSGIEVPDLTEDIVRCFYWNFGMEQWFAQFGALQVDVNWAARINAVKAHYRRTYRINRRWRDRIWQLRDYMVSHVDPESGQFLSSPVWQGWAALPTVKSQLADPARQFMATNHPDGGASASKALADVGASPAYASIVDAELGIISVEFVGDYQGQAEDFLPSAVEGVPTAHIPSANSSPLFTDGSVVGTNGPTMKLTRGHYASTIVTVVPSSPNSKASLHVETVGFGGEVKDLLPDKSQEALPFSNGPIWELRIGDQVATARYAWLHGRREEIERAMLSNEEAEEAREALRDTMVNPSEVREFALAASAALYASMPDHWEGVRTTTLSPAFTPVGTLRRVTWSIEADGAAFTRLETPAEIAPIDVMDVLPPSARKLFLRQVQP